MRTTIVTQCMISSHTSLRATSRVAKTFALSAFLICATQHFAQGAVLIDGAGVTRTDGNVIFPLGLYISQVTDTELQNIKNAGFNTVINTYYGKDGSAINADKFLTRANAKGLKVIQGIETFHSYRYDFPTATGKTGAELTTTMVNTLKGKAGLLGWYFQDEAPLDQIPQLEERYKLVKSLDSNHPVYSVTNLPNDAWRFWNSTDVIGVDPYPIPTESISQTYGKLSYVEQSFGSSKPTWAVTQSFDWSIYNGGPNVEPTGTQKKCMAYLALIAKSKGLMLYSYQDNFLASNGWNTGEKVSTAVSDRRWNEMKTIGSEISQIGTALSTGMDVALTDSFAGVRARMIQSNGATYLLLANIDNFGKQITLRLPQSGWGSAKSLDGVKTWAVEGGNYLVGELGPQEAIGLKLSTTKYSYPNLVQNPGFESNGGFSQTPTSWWTWAGSDNTGADANYCDAVTPFTGAYKLVQSKASYYEVDTGQTISGIPNGTYCLRAWVKSSGNFGAAVLGIGGYGGDKSVFNIGKYDSYVPIVIKDIKVTTGTATIDLYSKADANRWIQMDNVMLTKQTVDSTGQDQLWP